MAPLLSHHKDWIEQGVRENFGLFEAVNAPLIGGKDVPPYPTDIQALRSAIAALTAEQVDFMMDEVSPAASFFAKPILKVFGIEELQKLRGYEFLNKQHIFEGIVTQFTRGHAKSGSEGPAWNWGFASKKPHLVFPKTSHSSGLQALNLFRESLTQLPVGIRGMNVSTWATLMEAGLREGQPFDLPTMIDVRNYIPPTSICTMLDEHGLIYHSEEVYFPRRDVYRWTVANYYTLAGNFNLERQKPQMIVLQSKDGSEGWNLEGQSMNCHFYYSIDGPIEQ